jgi:carbonic anhydrase/acetyltransferase-like protein (isoleucine patch superfamily)
MILSSGAKKPNIHSSAYVAPGAIISGDVTIGADCAVLHGAVIVSEGAPLTIGARTVVMENAVLKASGGSALRFPLSIGERCIIGPQAYVVGAAIGNGCFVASGTKIFNGARLEDGSGVALGGIVQINSRLPQGASVPMQHIAFGDPAAVYPPAKAPEVHAQMHFYETVFNLEPGDDVRARAAAVYAEFLRKTHAQDAVLDQPRASKLPPRRASGEPPPTQTAEVDKVVDVMLLELEEMEHRRQEALKRQKGTGRPRA